MERALLEDLRNLIVPPRDSLGSIEKNEIKHQRLRPAAYKVGIGSIRAAEGFSEEMFVYVTVANRAAPITQGGELLKLDWQSKEVVRRTPIIPTSPAIPHPAPRGWARGGRGVVFTDDEVFVSSYHTVHVFDHCLRPLRQFGNPLFADIHDLAIDGDHLWVTSTAIDCAVKVDQAGNTLDVWWPREDPVISGRYGLSPLPLDKEADNRLSYLGRAHLEPGHTHLNTLRIVDNRPIAMLNRFGCVVGLHPTRILIEDCALRGAHNIVPTPTGDILINDTLGQALRIYRNDGMLRTAIRLSRFEPVKAIRRRFALRRLRIWLAEHSPSFKLSCWLADIAVRGSRPILVHGLCLTEHGTVLVGISPSMLLEIDLQTEELVSSFSLSEDLHESIVHIECGVTNSAHDKVDAGALGASGMNAIVVGNTR